ncbi:MAG: DUF6240 domain-containing protein [Alkaliphilus sp.]
MINNAATGNKISLNRIYSNNMIPNKKKENTSSLLKTSSRESAQVVSSGASSKNIDHINLLNKLNLPVEDNLLNGIEVLEKHGVNLSKKNLLSFVSAKKNLNFIANNLDSDMLQELKGKEVDIKQDPLQKIAEYIKEMKNDGENKSLLTLLKRGKKLSVQDTERITKELFGGKMGKDVKDAIKALHKSGAEITKKNINLVNDTLNNLNQLKNNEDETIIKIMKKEIEPNIENLIKTKNNITKSTVMSDEKLSQAATANYEKLLKNENSPNKNTITDRELAVMENEIKELLAKEGVESAKENIELAKKLIKNQVPVNNENMEIVRLSKEAIEILNGQLNYEKVTELYKAGINVEKESVVNLVELLNGLVAESEMIDNGIADDKKINEIMNQLNKLNSMQDKELILLLKKGIDFKLGILNKLVLSPKADNVLLKEDASLQKTYNTILGIASSLNILEDLQLGTIARQLSTNSLTTLDNLVLAHRNVENAILTNSRAVISASNVDVTLSEGVINEREAVLALTQNNIEASQVSIKQLFEISKQVNYIKHNITSLMVKNSIDNNINIMSMEISNLNEYVSNQEYDVDQVINLLPKINSSRDHILAMLMRNNIPLSLKQAENMFLLFDNQKQIGEQVGNIVVELEQSPINAAKKEAQEMRHLLTQIANEIKLGDVGFDKMQEKIAKSIELLQNTMSNLDGKTNGELEKTLNNLLNSLEFQNQMNRNNFVLQFPIMMSEYAKNLQLFVMDHKKGSKRINPKDMSLLLNIDTKNMDNVNIYVSVKNDKATIKFGVKEQKHKAAIEGSINDLKGLMKEVGYDIKNLSFRVDEEASIKGLIEATLEKEIVTKHFIDITI